MHLFDFQQQYKLLKLFMQLKKCPVVIQTFFQMKATNFECKLLSICFFFF